ncbi:hypothetical protein VP01_433g5 [Puccinia sorghi]|uniref:Uncharacterized protein n=1 Tax=Puccinia sorghi TaxID=27349 RepID=A0A0L6UPW9_9BASI|nr:hypothetical protein VP01_433g5 [Puccinia sorghi]
MKWLRHMSQDNHNSEKRTNCYKVLVLVRISVNFYPPSISLVSRFTIHPLFSPPQTPQPQWFKEYNLSFNLYYSPLYLTISLPRSFSSKGKFHNKAERKSTVQRQEIGKKRTAKREPRKRKKNKSRSKEARIWEQRRKIIGGQSRDKITCEDEKNTRDDYICKPNLVMCKKFETLIFLLTGSLESPFFPDASPQHHSPPAHQALRYPPRRPPCLQQGRIFLSPQIDSFKFLVLLNVMTYIDVHSFWYTAFLAEQEHPDYLRVDVPMNLQSFFGAGLILGLCCWESGGGIVILSLVWVGNGTNLQYANGVVGQISKMRNILSLIFLGGQIETSVMIIIFLLHLLGNYFNIFTPGFLNVLSNPMAQFISGSKKENYNTHKKGRLITLRLKWSKPLCFKLLRVKKTFSKPEKLMEEYSTFYKFDLCHLRTPNWFCDPPRPDPKCPVWKETLSAVLLRVSFCEIRFLLWITSKLNFHNEHSLSPPFSASTQKEILNILP